MTAPVTSVVFDLGGVLIDWDPRHLYRKLMSDEAEIERFLSTVCTPAWNARHDAGRPFAEGVAELVAVHPTHESMIRAYAERWNEMLAGPIPETVDVLEELHRARVPLFAVTNWSTETFPVALQRFPFLDRFRGIVVSGAEGVAKPDPRIFEVLAERFDLDPRRCLLVDDSPDNVGAAASVGFVAERFTTPAALRLRLVSMGLLTDDRSPPDIIARTADPESGENRA